MDARMYTHVLRHTYIQISAHTYIQDKDTHTRETNNKDNNLALYPLPFPPNHRKSMYVLFQFICGIIIITLF